MSDLGLAAPARGQEAESAQTVVEVLHVSVQLVHGADVELELVHGGDEERHDLRDDLARVPLVVLDRDRPVLLYTLQSCRGVQSAYKYDVVT